MHLWSFPICTGIQTCCQMPESSDTQPARGSVHMGSVSCSVPRLGSPRQRAVMCGSPQPMLGVSTVTVGAGLEKRRPSRFTNLGKPCSVWGAGSPAAGEAQMGKASPHVLVLLLHSSLCTHSGPCWRQNLGLEGSFPHECNRGAAEDNVVKPLEGAAPCSSSPLLPHPTLPQSLLPQPLFPQPLLHSAGHF